jgi:hypothetical protein
MRHVQINCAFGRTYEVEILSELTSEERFYFPGAKKDGGQDGLILKVKPLIGAPWIGIFSFGKLLIKGFTAIYSMPNQESICVIANRRGFFVSAVDPSKWEEVPTVPVLDVRSVVSQEILIIADYTHLFAYDSKGLKWQSARLAYDGFKITVIDNNILQGTYWDIRAEKEKTFGVDLRDGSQTGGVGEF